MRHEQGAGHAAEGYARSTGMPGVVLVTVGSRRHQHGDAAHRRADGFHPAGLHHRPGPDASDRQRRVPGMRHGRHHAALHQAQLAGERRRGSAAWCCTRHFYVATARPSRPGRWSTSRRTCSSRPASTTGPRKSDVHASYPSAREGATRRCDPQGGCSCWPAPSVRSSTPAAASSIPAPQPSTLLRELVEVTGFPITSTLMGLGAYPASGKNWLGMLGMHGTYEANMAMHDCDVMLCIGARFDDRITGRADAFSPNSTQDPHRHRSLVDQQEHPRRRADRRRRRQCARRSAAGVQGRSEEARHQGVVGRHRDVARAQLARLQAEQGRHHAAIWRCSGCSS